MLLVAKQRKYVFKAYLAGQDALKWLPWILACADQFQKAYIF